MIANVLRTLRQVLTLISLFTVLFSERIPRPLFDMIAMTYLYEWRAFSYATFLHDDYPPFDFQSAADDGVEACGRLVVPSGPCRETSTSLRPVPVISWSAPLVAAIPSAFHFCSTPGGGLGVMHG